MSRVAFFSGDITRSGGTERVSTVIANQLAKREEYTVFFLSLTEQGKKPGYPLDEKIPRTFFSKKWIRPGVGYLPVIWKLIRYLKRNRIDILIDIDGVLDVVSLPAKFFTHVKLISWEHFNFYADLGTSYRKIIRRLAARYADAIVTLTEQDRSFYCQNLTIRHTIQTIYNPIDYIQPEKDALTKDYTQKIILSVGRLTDVKGFLRIPQIADGIRKKYPELSFQWLIAGEGEQRAQMEEEIRRWKVEGYVRLLGHIENITEIYKKALVYVMTSRHEGLPMVLLEAKMHGIPCVSFDIITGPSEIIQDRVDGFLVPCTENDRELPEEMVDALGKLLTEEELYRSFAAHTQDNIGKFRLEHVMECWDSLLSSFSS